jgi:TfoX/Sxy family transcriptional regulator of competence genes
MLPVMKKMRRPPDALVAWFPQILPKDPRVERRRMFGCPCAFVSGHMFCGVFEDRVFLRLGDEDRARFLALSDAEPWRPMGRPMGGYVVAPPDLVEDPDGIAPWMRAAFGFASALPPKVAKVREAKGTKAAKGAKAARETTKAKPAKAAKVGRALKAKGRG